MKSTGVRPASAYVYVTSGGVEEGISILQKQHFRSFFLYIQNAFSQSFHSHISVMLQKYTQVQSKHLHETKVRAVNACRFHPKLKCNNFCEEHLRNNVNLSIYLSIQPRPPREDYVQVSICPYCETPSRGLCDLRVIFLIYI